MVKRILMVLPFAAILTAAVPAAAQRAAAAESAGAEAQVREAGQQIAQKERELARLNQQLERSRREMEAAAREISRLSVSRSGPFVIGDVTAPVMIARGRIDANIASAADGALVVAVTPGGPADSAGILSGDIITAIAGNPIAGGDESVGSVVAALESVEPGTTVAVEVRRAGEPMTFDVETEEGARFRQFFGAGPAFAGPQYRVNVRGPFRGDLPDVNAITRDVNRFFDVSNFLAASWRDMELVALSPDLGSYFGTEAGLLVIRAPEQGGLDLHDGDVILTIGGRTPASPEHAMRILASFEPGETLEIRLMRHERRETISYALPEPGAADN